MDGSLQNATYGKVCLHIALNYTFVADDYDVKLMGSVMQVRWSRYETCHNDGDASIMGRDARVRGPDSSSRRAIEQLYYNHTNIPLMKSLYNLWRELIGPAGGQAQLYHIE